MLDGTQGELQAYAPIIPRSLPRYARGIAATVAAILFTAAMAPAALAAASTRRQQMLAKLARIWSLGIIKICKVNVELVGLENLAKLDSAVLVSNHQSFFDVFAMIAFLPVEIRFIAKHELLKFPAVGYALERSDHIVINRQKGGREIRQAMHLLRKGFKIAVFPEGHRFNDGRVHEFEDGAAWLAILSQHPVVPIAVSGSGDIHPPSAILAVPGKTMRIQIGRPIATTGLHGAQRAELTERLHREVSELYSGALDAASS